MHSRTILTLVRHGQTSANLDGVWHGSSDTRLTEHGQAQADRVAGFLSDHGADATAVYCSPLSRARHTAEPIAQRLGVAVHVEPDLSEYDIGRWEGLSFRELNDTHQLWHHIARDPDWAPHGGESPRQVVTRLTSCLRGLARKHPNDRIIAVSHGGALSLALADIMGPEAEPFSLMMDNCAVSDLVLEPRPKLLHFNLNAHLEGL